MDNLSKLYVAIKQIAKSIVVGLPNGTKIIEWTGPPISKSAALIFFFKTNSNYTFDCIVKNRFEFVHTSDCERSARRRVVEKYRQQIGHTNYYPI